MPQKKPGEGEKEIRFIADESIYWRLKKYMAENHHESVGEALDKLLKKAGA